MTYTSYKSCSAIPDIVTLYMIEFFNRNWTLNWHLSKSQLSRTFNFNGLLLLPAFTRQLCNCSNSTRNRLSRRTGFLSLPICIFYEFSLDRYDNYFAPQFVLLQFTHLLNASLNLKHRHSMFFLFFRTLNSLTRSSNLQYLSEKYSLPVSTSNVESIASHQQLNEEEWRVKSVQKVKRNLWTRTSFSIARISNEIIWRIVRAYNAAEAFANDPFKCYQVRVWRAPYTYTVFARVYMRYIVTRYCRRTYE